MRKAFIATVLLFFLLGGSYTIGKLWRERQQQHSAQIDREYDNGFRCSEYCLEQKPFVVVISGYNNGAYLERTLRSIFSQVYDRYRLIYIDDASTDGSAALAQECIEASGQMG